MGLQELGALITRRGDRATGGLLLLLAVLACAGQAAASDRPQAWISQAAGSETELAFAGGCVSDESSMPGLSQGTCADLPPSPGPTVMLQTPGTAVLRFSGAPTSVSVAAADAVAPIDPSHWQVTFGHALPAGTGIGVNAVAPDFSISFVATSVPPPAGAAPPSATPPSAEVTGVTRRGRQVQVVVSSSGAGRLAVYAAIGNRRRSDVVHQVLKGPGVAHLRWRLRGDGWRTVVRRGAVVAVLKSPEGQEVRDTRRLSQ